MTQYIILSRAERDAIRGNSSAHAAIEPIELKDGTFVISDQVLDDPDHSQRVTRVVGLRQKARLEKNIIDTRQIEEPKFDEVKATKR